MTIECKGSTHCLSVRCDRCSWRYAGRIARRILTSADGSFHAVTICIPDATPFGFRRWRRDLRNRVDYLRRKSPRWRNFGLHVWRCHDGKLRGIVSLGTLGPAEVKDGLARWPITLRRISPDALRLEIYHVVKPPMISLEGVARGRYWSRAASVRPCREPSASSIAGLTREHDEPMPFLW